MKVEIELQPFTVPNFVIARTKPGLRQEGMQEQPKFALRDLPAEALAELCDHFRREVFIKADKVDPSDYLVRSGRGSDHGNS